MKRLHILLAMSVIILTSPITALLASHCFHFHSPLARFNVLRSTMWRKYSKQCSSLFLPEHDNICSAYITSSLYYLGHAVHLIIFLLSITLAAPQQHCVSFFMHYNLTCFVRTSLKSAVYSIYGYTFF